MHSQLYYVAAVYTFLLAGASTYNFYRAELYPGRKPLLLSSIVLFAVGTGVSGCVESGLVPRGMAAPSGAALTLSLAIFLTVSWSAYASLRARMIP